MFLILSIFIFITTTLSQNPLGLTYLDANCHNLKSDTAWFEIDISPKYQRNCIPLYGFTAPSNAHTRKQLIDWHRGKSCLRTSSECTTFSRQYCTDNFLAVTADSSKSLPTFIEHRITTTSKEKDYLFFNPPVGTGNYIYADLRNGIRSIIIPLNNLHPDDQNFRQVFRIQMTENVVAHILNNTSIYKKNTQTIQDNLNVLSIDKICLLANDVLRTAAMKYDFNNCFRLAHMASVHTKCAAGGDAFNNVYGKHCTNTGEKHTGADLGSCLQNLPLINASKMAYNNKALDIMRTAVVSGISAIPYAGLVLAATTNAILGPTADEMILNEYKGAQYDEKAVILRGVRQQVLKESSELAKGYVKDNWDDILKSIKKIL
ncbi:hypothetical protein K502DRAFT_328527 [Neoconidiobolus thromboides FSU 785]|nr:hypothetical protein K502DRAFT_328527 [Neoconidiobolus thromboides FSU 785]